MQCHNIIFDRNQEEDATKSFAARFEGEWVGGVGADSWWIHPDLNYDIRSSFQAKFLTKKSRVRLLFFVWICQPFKEKRQGSTNLSCNGRAWFFVMNGAKVEWTVSMCHQSCCFRFFLLLVLSPLLGNGYCMFLALFKKVSYNPISFLVYFIWDTDQIYTSGDSSYQLAGQIEKILDRIKLFAKTGCWYWCIRFVRVLEAPDRHIPLSFLDPFSFCVPWSHQVCWDIDFGH